MTYRILLVDDEEDILDILSEFLIEQRFEVACATSGRAALDLLAQGRFDLLLADINMPGMKGFELCKIVADTFPTVKSALITAYDVRDYLQLAKTYNIGNIITKTTPFNFEETLLLITNILSEEFFGLERYIDGPVKSKAITGSSDIEAIIKNVLADIPDELCRKRFRHGFAESVINAVYYGAKEEHGERKSEWDLNIQLSPQDAVVVSWGFDREKAGIAVTDQKGRLTKKDVLYWLERNTSRDERGQPLAFFDPHGKGLFITHETNDRVIINIKRGRTTEVVMLNYKEGLYNGHRPLWIQEA